MRFDNFLLNHRIFVFFLSGSDHSSDHFFMCVFPKVLIIIMFMGGGAKLALGGGANPQKISARYAHRFYISPPPEQNPEYAPGYGGGPEKLTKV